MYVIRMFGARMKIMWEEQLVDPPIDYITPVNVPSSVFYWPVKNSVR